MRVIRWRNADTGVESLTITANGVYFPVGKTDSGFKLKLSMASAGQSASVDIVRSANGDRAGYSAVSVSGTTESKAPAILSLSYGIVVSGISGTLNAILDDETPVTVFPDAGGGRFSTTEDVEAYYYGASVPAGFQTTVGGYVYTFNRSKLYKGVASVPAHPGTSFANAAAMQAYLTAQGFTGNALWDIAANDWVGGDFPVRINGRNTSDFYGTPGCPAIFDGAGYSFNGTTSAWVADATGGSSAFPSSLNLIAAHKQYAGYSAGGNSIAVAADYTVCRKHSIPFKFYNFTLVLENYGATPVTYDAVFVRVGGNGNTQNTPVQMTYQGSTTITVPAASVANNKYTIPGIIECDEIINYNLDTTYTTVPTSGTPVAVWVRAHTTTGGTFANGQDLTSFAAIQDASLAVAGDQATTWSTQTLASTGPIFSSLKLRTKRPSLNVLFIGDSLTQAEWPEIACAAANAGNSARQIVWYKQAVGGVGSGTFLGWAKALIPVLKPDYVYIPSFTPNDGSNVFLVGQVHQNIMAAIAFAKANGVKVITSTPFPDDNFDNSAFLLRVVPLANEVLVSSDLVLDWYGAMNDPAAPGKYISGYTTDGVHPNAAGKAVIQPIANAFFANLLAKA